MVRPPERNMRCRTNDFASSPWLLSSSPTHSPSLCFMFLSAVAVALLAALAVGRKVAEPGWSPRTMITDSKYCRMPPPDRVYAPRNQQTTHPVLRMAQVLYSAYSPAEYSVLPPRLQPRRANLQAPFSPTHPLPSIHSPSPFHCCGASEVPT